MSSPTNRVAWPFYIALDVSKSMWGRNDNIPANQQTPWEAVRDSLPELLFALEESPSAADIAHLTIVAFSDDVETYLPRSRIADGQASLPKLPQGTQTNYGKLFGCLRGMLTADIEELTTQYSKVKRPTLYLITDGDPVVGPGKQSESEWVPALADVHGIQVRQQPIAVIALGFGTVKEQTLARIAQAPGGAFVADAPDAQPDALIKEMINSILDSMILSVSASELEFQTPPGMRRIA